MRIKYKIALFVLLAASIVLLRILFLNMGDISVLHPSGWVGDKERDLMVTATLLMLIVVVPVFFMAFLFAWKYRSDHKEKYEPEWADHPLAEVIWWGVPCVIVVILSVLCWKSSHELDPFKPLDVPGEPVTVQVVALQWKWLFIYPEYNIATVNFLQIPVHRPINFMITADAPMNSFWIPKLGGQVYAMPGMQSKLHLIADKEGAFPGSSANLSGKGFSGMRFTAQATSEDDFDAWISSTQGSKERLDLDTYKQLAAPSENNPPASFRLEKADLFDWIMMKFMMPMEK